jgi:hypothetical protein
MSMNQRDRDAFLYEAGREGLPIAVARKLLRYGTTLHRLAEAQCNGDWPYENGTGGAKPCSRCEGLWRAQLVGGVCPDCRTIDAVWTLLAENNKPPWTLLAENNKPPYGSAWTAKIQGDPRGAVLRIVAPSGRELVAG